jgi:hypothetical protein
MNGTMPKNQTPKLKIFNRYWDDSETVVLKITGRLHPMVIIVKNKITTFRQTRNHTSFNSSLYVGISIRLLHQRSVPEDNRIHRTPKYGRDMIQVGGVKERLSSTKSKICNSFFRSSARYGSGNAPSSLRKR